MQFDNTDQFKQIISDNQTFVIVTHLNPDGDALGSSLGLAAVIQALGKQAAVITPDNAPTFYSWMPGIRKSLTYDRQTEECDKLIDSADVIVYLDFNCTKRIQALGEKIEQSKAVKMLIDHHLYPEVNVDAAFSDPTAPATCELVYNLLRATGFEEHIGKEAATNFYTGIITDTGALCYNSSKPETYLTVASLLDKGIDKTHIHDKIFNNKHFRRLQLMGFCLYRKMERINKMPITMMALSDEELRRFNYNTGDTEGFVNYPLSIKNVEVSALILERPDKIKISFRSKGEFPVNEFSARFFGGGGHKNAAGGTFAGTLDEAVARYKMNIVQFYNEWTEKNRKKK